MKNKKLFSCLVGSHNYNLNDKNSDKDFKVFLIPTFDDLYFNNKITKATTSELSDIEFHDIRKLEKLLWCSNINFLECLYSIELNINNDLNDEIKSLAQKIINYRDDIAKINLPYLYNACINMSYNKIKLIDKGTKSSKYLLDKFGYDTKQIMTSLRILDFLKRFADSEFKDFKNSIFYKDSDKFRKFLLDIKQGKYEKDKLMNLYKFQLKEIDKKYKYKYLSSEPNVELKEELSIIIKKIIEIDSKNYLNNL